MKLSECGEWWVGGGGQRVFGERHNGGATYSKRHLATDLGGCWGLFGRRWDSPGGLSHTKHPYTTQAGSTILFFNVVSLCEID